MKFTMNVLKSSLLIFTLLHISILMSSQTNIQSYNKMNYELFQLISDEHRNTNSEINLFVKGNPEEIKKIVLHYGGYVFHTGTFSTIRISQNKIPYLIDSEHVEMIYYSDKKGSTLLDSAIHHNNVKSVHEGNSPLPNAYKGKDVIVGILDYGGIDWLHGDFRNDEDSTRILYIWDQVTTDYDGNDYGYGKIYTSDSINNENIDMTLTASHGTQVAGIATGNGNHIDSMTGMAPESDIIFVSIPLSGNFEANLINGAAFIYDKAEELGKPCVINSSLGSNFGPRDNNDATVVSIGELISAEPGRTFVQAAGNAGNVNFHLGYEVTSDTSFTWFQHHAASSSGDVYFFADTADLADVDFNLEVIHRTNQTLLGETGWFNIPNDIPTSENTLNSTSGTFTHPITGAGAGSWQLFVENLEGRYGVYFVTTPSPTNSYLQLTTTGTGRIDTWSNFNLTGTSSVRNVGTVDTGKYSQYDIDAYKAPNNESTLVSGIACSEKVITVGNYVNRVTYNDYNGDLQIIPVEQGIPTGNLYHKSSKGPTRDGYLKPNITATGNFVYTTERINRSLTLQTNNPTILYSTGYHTQGTGTSMSAPVVTGAVALFFEENPSATYSEVFDFIQNSARIDTFVIADNYPSAIPNNYWGYGKLDAYAFIENSLIYGCMDSLSISYNSNADVEDGSCEYDFESLEVSPNPFTEQIEISYTVQSEKEYTVYVTNSLGQTTYITELTMNKESFVLDHVFSSPGIYFLTLNDGSDNLITKKIVHVQSSF